MPAKSDSVEARLTRLETKIDYLVDEVKALKDNHAHRIDRLEVDKLSVDAFESYRSATEAGIKDRETRIRRLEWSWALATGILAGLQFYFNYIHK